MSSEPQTASSTQRDSEEWGFSGSVGICPKCHAAFLSATGTVERVCPVCFSAPLSHQADYPVPANPELILPFAIDPARIETILADWSKATWLCTVEMNEKTLAARLTRLFIPMWLVDGEVSGNWQAQAGYTYQVASSHDAYSNGQWSSRQVNETRLKWEPRAGCIQRAYQNLTVQALEEHGRLAPLMGAFPIQRSVPYQPGLIHSESVLLPDIPIEKAFPLAKAQFDRAAGADCLTAVGAQQIEQMNLACDYQDLNWTLLLLPLFTTYYREKNGVLHSVLINGVTGQVSGVRRASQSRGWRWTAVMAALGAACIFAAVLVGLLAALIPPVALLSGVLFVAGACLAIASPIPAIRVWQYNRRSEELTFPSGGESR
jgi:hypothetical protein